MTVQFLLGTLLGVGLGAIGMFLLIAWATIKGFWYSGEDR